MGETDSGGSERGGEEEDGTDGDDSEADEEEEEEEDEEEEELESAAGLVEAAAGALDAGGGLSFCHPAISASSAAVNEPNSLIAASAFTASNPIPDNCSTKPANRRDEKRLLALGGLPTDCDTGDGTSGSVGTAGAGAAALDCAEAVAGVVGAAVDGGERGN